MGMGMWRFPVYGREQGGGDMSWWGVTFYCHPPGMTCHPPRYDMSPPVAKCQPLRKREDPRRGPPGRGRDLSLAPWSKPDGQYRPIERTPAGRQYPSPARPTGARSLHSRHSGPGSTVRPGPANGDARGTRSAACSRCGNRPRSSPRRRQWAVGPRRAPGTRPARGSTRDWPWCFVMLARKPRSVPGTRSRRPGKPGPSAALPSLPRSIPFNSLANPGPPAAGRRSRSSRARSSP